MSFSTLYFSTPPFSLSLSAFFLYLHLSSLLFKQEKCWRDNTCWVVLGKINIIKNNNSRKLKHDYLKASVNSHALVTLLLPQNNNHAHFQTSQSYQDFLSPTFNWHPLATSVLYYLSWLRRTMNPYQQRSIVSFNPEVSQKNYNLDCINLTNRRQSWASTGLIVFGSRKLISNTVFQLSSMSTGGISSRILIQGLERELLMDKWLIFNSIDRLVWLLDWSIILTVSISKYKWTLKRQ